MHLFSSIIIFGTSDIFPEETEFVSGTRKGYETNYYQPKKVNFFQKFGLVTNIPFILLLI